METIRKTKQYYSKRKGKCKEKNGKAPNDIYKYYFKKYQIRHMYTKGQILLPLKKRGKLQLTLVEAALGSKVIRNRYYVMFDCTAFYYTHNVFITVVSRCTLNSLNWVIIIFLNEKSKTIMFPCCVKL